MLAMSRRRVELCLTIMASSVSLPDVHQVVTRDTERCDRARPNCGVGARRSAPATPGVPGLLLRAPTPFPGNGPQDDEGTLFHATYGLASCRSTKFCAAYR
jgi:hypothetical protein